MHHRARFYCVIICEFEVFVACKQYITRYFKLIFVSKIGIRVTSLIRKTINKYFFKFCTERQKFWP